MPYVLLRVGSKCKPKGMRLHPALHCFLLPDIYQILRMEVAGELNWKSSKGRML
jgi:hypothetical protein